MTNAQAANPPQRRSARQYWPLVATLCLALVTGPAAAATASPAVPLGEDDVLWFEFNPVVVSPSVVQNVVLVIKTTGGPIDNVQLELQDGSTVNLANNGLGVFSTVLTHAQVMYDYTAADYNHNFIGYLHVRDGATSLLTFNMFVNVADERVPDVRINLLAADVQVSPNVVNIRVAGMDPAAPNAASATLRFYQLYADVYDFINVIFVPERFDNRTHEVVSNAVTGIGLAASDATATYGSDGNLLGITRYPLTTYFDMAETGSVHEVGHQWINYLDLPILASGGAHWPLSSLARGIMGYSGTGGQGLNFPFDLQPLGGGDYKLVATTRPPVFNDLELYLMGMLPSSGVGSHFVFNDQDQTACYNCTLEGPVTTVTLANITAMHGARVPSNAAAQHTFRVATIVMTRNRLLNAREMAFFNYMAARSSLTAPVHYSAGFSNGITYPFYSATRRVGCLTSNILFSAQVGCYDTFVPLSTK